ncbi:hypothetical protein N9W79_01530 [bacterium]|nr:hypothetical protein [bacterium]
MKQPVNTDKNTASSGSTNKPSKTIKTGPLKQKAKDTEFDNIDDRASELLPNSEDGDFPVVHR